MKNYHTFFKLFALLLFLSWGVGILSAQTTHTVDDDIGVDNGTSPFATITAAIAAAVDGDIIDITGGADNIHTEQGITVDKSLTIRGQGQSTTIVQAHPIEGMATDRVFYITGVNLTLAFEDFTVRHGVSSSGGGINASIFNSIFSMTRMTISNNWSNNLGGGMTITGSKSTTFTDCVISHNEAVERDATRRAGSGGGLYIDPPFSGPVITQFIRCTIAYNKSGSSGGGISFRQPGLVRFINCTIHGNVAGLNFQPGHDSFVQGGGISSTSLPSSLQFFNCTIAGNSFAPLPHEKRGAGIVAGGGLKFTNTIVADNTGALDIRSYRIPPVFISSLVESCRGCTNPPTFSGDPNLGPPTYCGEQLYLEPQAGSDALDNGAAPGGEIPVNDICGKIRVAPHDLGSYDKSGIVPPPPVAECKDITVALDASGMGAIAASDVDNGSSAALGINAMTVSPNTFDCGDLGVNTVTLTITDNLADSDNCTAKVTVTSPNDVTPPTITCPTSIVRRNADPASCNHTTVGTDLDPLPIADNCHVASIINDFNNSSSLGGAVFPFGKTAVTWTVTDGNGNTATCTYDIRIRDKTAPVFAKCQPDTTIKVAVGITGHVFDPMLSDNCTAYGDLVITGLPLPGSFFPVGTTSVTWTAKDKKNNTGSCTMNIKVETTAQAPTGWSSSSIGTLTQCVTNYNATTKKLTIKTNGGTVFNTADNFCGITMSSSLASIDLRARVTHTGSSSTDQAGIMLRQSLSANAVQTAIAINGTGVPTMYNRATTGGITLGTSAAAVTTPYYVRLHRVGATITGYISADGVTWTLVMTYPTTLTNPLFLSLFATSSATNGTATIDNITLNGSSLRLGEEGPASGLSVSTFPNPFGKQVSYQVEGLVGDNLSVRLLDMQGRVIHQELMDVEAMTSYEGTLQTSELAAGMYMLEVRAGAQRILRKVVKQ